MLQLIFEAMYDVGIYKTFWYETSLIFEYNNHCQLLFGSLLVLYNTISFTHCETVKSQWESTDEYSDHQLSFIIS